MSPLRALLARPLACAALLCALTLALHWKSGAFGFLAYDDDVYVTANPGVQGGLSWAGVRWAFTTAHAANWHPLTWLSHQLDVELFGSSAAGPHRVNAALHALNAALLLLALHALTRSPGRSALVAALFALHPLRVESVAWIAERKDLLAAGFAFGCVWAHATWARGGGWPRYALALLLFALGLLAKPMLVTLPCVLLLLDAWPLGRLRTRAAWLEKLPFLALSAASSVVTVLVQRAGGAFGEHEHIDLPARVANALHACALYAWRSVWPSGLSVHHPHPALAEPPGPSWTPAVLAALAFLVAVSALLVALRRRAPYALTGWLWFLGMLVPVLGLVQVGLQSWAERYSYLPCVGLAIALVWALDALPRTSAQRSVALGSAGVALAVLAVASARQLEVWRDDATLFAHALEVEEANPVAHVQLGRALEARGDPAGAEQHYRRALALRPSLALVGVNLARVLEQQGKTAEAVPFLRRALELVPDDLATANHLAWVLATSRTCAQPAEALALAERLVRASGGARAEFLESLAAAQARLGRYEEAVATQERALARVPPAYRAPLETRLALYRARQPCLESP